MDGVLTRKKSLGFDYAGTTFAYLPGYRESALRASRAAVGRPQRRAGLGTGQLRSQRARLAGLRAGEGPLPGHLRPGCGLRLLRLGNIPGAEGEGERVQATYPPPHRPRLSPDGKGNFAFEKEDGTADLIPADELRRFLAGSGVQCVFASGCQTG